MRESDKIRRGEAKALGICVACLKKPAAEGHASCPACLRSMRVRDKARRTANAGDGSRCYICGQPADPGYKTCAKCREINRLTSERWAAKNPERRKEIERNSYHKKRAEGRCTICGKPSEYGCVCQACRPKHLEEMRLGRLRRIENQRNNEDRDLQPGESAENPRDEHGSAIQHNQI